MPSAEGIGGFSCIGNSSGCAVSWGLDRTITKVQCYQ